MGPLRKPWPCLAAAFGLLLVPAQDASGATRGTVVLATTTSTQDSGLLEVLVPLFERRTGYTVKPIAVGTGQALALGARGEADVVLAHAPDLEMRFVAEGKLRNRRPVMYNDFIVVGPPDDPAKVRSTRKTSEAFRQIAGSRARFVSRGDNSGTHTLERALWAEAGIQAVGPWYIEAGQGMGATLAIAAERAAYTLADRATHLAFRQRLKLAVLLEGDIALRNIYSVLEVNPTNGPRVNAAGGTAFADFLVSREAQAVIGTSGVEKFGRPLFVPLAGRREEEIGR